MNHRIITFASIAVVGLSSCHTAPPHEQKKTAHDYRTVFMGGVRIKPTDYTVEGAHIRIRGPIDTILETDEDGFFKINLRDGTYSFNLVPFTAKEKTLDREGQSLPSPAKEPTVIAIDSTSKDTMYWTFRYDVDTNFKAP